VKELKLLLKKLLIFGFRSFGLLQLLQQIPQSSEKIRDVIRSAFLLAVLLGMRRRRRSLESLERVSGEEEGSPEGGGGNGLQ
jgi:hypothetical protein